MTQQEAEVTIQQILRSPYFSISWKVAMFVFAAASGFVAWSVAEVPKRIDSIEATQQDRADLGDEFQDYVKGEISDVKSAQEKTNDTVGAVRIDVARILGVVQEMQRQDLASRTAFRLTQQ